MRKQLRTLFKKGWNAAASILRRVKAINTPWGGVQLSEPAPDLSFARAQDEWELRHEIYLLAGIEAYAAKDAARRLSELMVPEVQAVEKYLAENPETRRWVERNIEAGTCCDCRRRTAQEEGGVPASSIGRAWRRAHGESPIPNLIGCVKAAHGL